jgi:hypothetical protein
VIGGVMLFLDWAKKIKNDYKIKIHYVGHQVIIQKI